jgi:glutamate-1-semialdehyde 2,1-aminomutase
MRTLLLQETIQRGILMTSLVVSYSHTDEDIDKTLDAIDGAMSIYAKALADDVSSYLIGPPSQLEFRKYNTQGNHSSYPKGSTVP